MQNIVKEKEVNNNNNKYFNKWEFEIYLKKVIIIIRNNKKY